LAIHTINQEMFLHNCTFKGRESIFKFILWVPHREYGMFWLLPHPFPLLPAVSTTAKHRKTENVRQLADIRGGGGGVGAKSFDGKKAWPSINSSILFGSPSPL
jgi:hypothetical protein